MFQRYENRLNSLILKLKQQKALQLHKFSLNLLKIFFYFFIFHIYEAITWIVDYVIWLYYILLINNCKFMRGYLYFPNTLKAKRQYIGLY